MGSDADRPSGIVAFLFSDVEGSTALWERHPETMAEALAVHDEVFRGEIDRHLGYVFSTAGDSFAAAFHTATAAAAAAIAIHRRLESPDSADQVQLRVRLHAMVVTLTNERDELRTRIAELRSVLAEERRAAPPARGPSRAQRRRAERDRRRRR